MRATARLALLVVAVGMAAASGGGEGSFMDPELGKQLASVDDAFGRGDAATGCARLAEAVPKLFEWAEGMRGNRAPRAHELADRISMLAGECHMNAEGPTIPGGWKAAYDELKATAKHKTSWTTWFIYVSMFAVGFGVWAVLRRLKS